ncbi:hypothetical protein PYCC9005_001227 [Savitreella phatthalungensis]
MLAISTSGMTYRIGLSVPMGATTSAPVAPTVASAAEVTGDTISRVGGDTAEEENVYGMSGVKRCAVTAELDDPVSQNSDHSDDDACKTTSLTIGVTTEPEDHWTGLATPRTPVTVANPRRSSSRGTGTSGMATRQQRYSPIGPICHGAHRGRTRTRSPLVQSTTPIQTQSTQPLRDPVEALSQSPLPANFDLVIAPRLRDLAEMLLARNGGRSERRFCGVLPGSWVQDFPRLPRWVFSSDPISLRTGSAAPPIRSLGRYGTSGETRAKMAIEALMRLGSRVRARMTQRESERNTKQPQRIKTGVEGLVKDEIQRFCTWARKDAGLRDEILGRFLRCCRGSLERDDDDRRAAKQVEDKVTRWLHKLATLHRQTAETYVTAEREHRQTASALASGVSVYAIAVCGTQVAVVGLACGDARAPLRTLLVGDLAVQSQDLANTLSIILTIMTARQECLDAKELSASADVDLLKQFRRLNMETDDEADESDHVANGEEEDVDR